MSHLPVLIALYLVATLLVGLLTRRRTQSATDYLNASHSLPFVAVLGGYIAANCGALDLVGLSALAAQYGAVAFHFYLLGAIPAMVFLGLFLMPVYRRNNVGSVPEYLQVRFGERMRLLNAGVTAVLLLLLAGVSLYAMGRVATVLLGTPFLENVLLFAGVVATYVLLGGLRATIYNELLQLAVMLAGAAPLALLCVRRRGDWLPRLAASKAHLWSGMPVLSHAARMDKVGLVFGLGCVLSFSYWCTDFVMMQRAFTARTEFQARQVPLWAGFGKLLFAQLVVLPGLAAAVLLPQLHAYDDTMPRMMALLYGPLRYGSWLLGLGATALSASLMSALAANLSAFASVTTNDLYRTAMAPGRSEEHYLRAGRTLVVVGAAGSVALSYLNFLFSNLMEHVQLIFSVLGAPFWAVFVLGMLTTRVRERDAIRGFLAGASLSLMHTGLVMRGVLAYGSTLSAVFYAAMLGFTAAIVVALASHALHGGGSLGPAALRLGVARGSRTEQAVLWGIATVLLLLTVWLNLLWR